MPCVACRVVVALALATVYATHDYHGGPPATAPGPPPPLRVTCPTRAARPGPSRHATRCGEYMRSFTPYAEFIGQRCS